MRALPRPTTSRRSPVLRSEVRTAAIAAAGGVLAGAATVAAVRAVRRRRLAGGLLAAARRRRRAARERRRQPLLPGRRPPARPLSAGRAGLGSRSEARGRPSPFDRPASPAAGSDGPDAAGRRGGVATRLLHVEGSPVLVRAWQPAADRVLLRAEAVDPARGHGAAGGRGRSRRRPGREQLELAIERMRFALGVDDDLGEFHRALPPRPAARPADPRAGPASGRGAGPWPWEALACGDRQAADRVRAGGADRAPHRRPLGARAWRGRGRRCATSRRRRRSPAGRRPSWPSMDLAPAAPRRCARVAREVAGGPLPTRRRRPPTAGCWRSPRSAPGRSSAWASSAAASPTRCPPATSATSSWSAASPASAAAPRSRRWRSSTLRMSRSAASSEPSPWPACTGSWPRARRSALRRLRGLGGPRPGARLRAWTGRGSSAGDQVSITRRCARAGTGTGPTTRSTNFSTRSRPADRTTGAWSSACR